MTPTRIQRKRTRGYKHPPNTRYCGRGTKWGNPFKVTKQVETSTLYILHYEEDFIMQFEKKEDALKTCLVLYKSYLDRKLLLKKLDLSELKKYSHLSCFCPLECDCHVDILIKKLNEL